MADITLKGNSIHTVGELPEVGSVAPDFELTNKDLAEVSLKDFEGQVKILNIVPSLDTGICAMSAEQFDKAVESLDQTVVLTISGDLPMASSRFCESKNVDRVITLSTFRSPSFAKDYGVEIVDGPIRGLCARCVVVLDRDNNVVYTEQVPEIAQEPNYDAALEAVRTLGA